MVPLKLIYGLCILNNALFEIMVTPLAALDVPAAQIDPHRDVPILTRGETVIVALDAVLTVLVVFEEAGVVL